MKNLVLSWWPQHWIPVLSLNGAQQKNTRFKEYIISTIEASQTPSVPDTASSSSSFNQLPPAKKSKISFFDDLMPNSATIGDSENNVNSVVENWIEFWKNNENQFSFIAKIAPNYLSIPASSAPVERLFSIAGKIFWPERCRLTDKNFETLMFVRSNFEFKRIMSLLKWIKVGFE